MKNTTLTIIILISLFTSSLVAQTNNNEKIWDALLKNDRSTALEFTKKINTNKASMEELVLKQLVNVENGIYKRDKTFMPNFTSKPNFDYYLYALWNENFIFKDYLSQSFDDDIIKNVNFIASKELKNTTVRGGFTYLDGIVARYQNDFKKYKEKIDKLQAITNWQYCGVFENLNKSGMDIAYAPETTAYSATPFNANSNGEVNWFTSTFSLNSAYQFMRNFNEYGNGINYAQTFLKLDKEQTFIFKLGIGKATKLWVNDVLVFEETEDHINELDAHSIKITVPKGNNRILIKTSNTSYSYFILRVFNENNELLNPKELGFTSTYTPYNKSTKVSLKLEQLPSKLVQFFNNLDNTKANTSFFNDYLLINTYLRNSNEKEAKKIINKYVEKYPKSSFLRVLLIKCYNIEKDYEKSKEINENIKNDDKDYTLTLIEEILEPKKLFKMPIDEMNERLDKIAKATDLAIVKKTTQFFKYARLENKKGTKKATDEIYALAKKHRNQKILASFAQVYGNFFNDQNKTLKLLTEINNTYFSPSAHNGLMYLYDKLNRKDKVIELQKDFVKKVPEEMGELGTLVEKLHKYEKYKESLKYIDDAFKIFPYSFTFMRFKGDALIQLGKEKEALKWYKKSYAHDSGNSALRKKIQDLEKQDDPLKKLVLDKPYEYIKAHRNKLKSDENYDINILLDEVNVQIFKEGGSKNHTVFIYEVLTEKGVEQLKELNLGLSYGYTINKSEIVKPKGKIVPAERSGSSFVFNNLSIGDVILIDFETSSTSTGRFYKDYYDTYQFGSYYPVGQSIYRVVLPKDNKINYKIKNDKINFDKKTIDNFEVYEFKQVNPEVLPPYESYMPEDCDVAAYLHLSTIKNWGLISNWYSDLVRTQIKYNSTVNNLFDELFPDGVKNLSDEEKAKKIYYYMMNNLTYSFVNFKQSGFVPQKPSKTITSKMGDCKDFSTLFFTLAKKAELETNLVLVSTSSEGKNALVLPSTDFNHCIVRVKMDGKEHYIELTDKFLPFDSTPNSLIGALALNIPYRSSESNTNDLFVLNPTAKTNNKRKLDIDLNISKDTQKVKIVNTSYNYNSYYRKMLDEKNEVELKKQLEDSYERKSKLDLTLLDYKITKNHKGDPEVVFTTNFKINNKIKKIGKMKLLKLPKFANPYTNDVINLDTRKYPLVYNKYESIDNYQINYSIELSDAQKFVEVPENVDLQFKGHHYTITYSLANNAAKLNVSIHAIIDKSDIQTNEYKAYKDFVKNVLEEDEALIGFK